MGAQFLRRRRSRVTDVRGGFCEVLPTGSYVRPGDRIARQDRTPQGDSLPTPIRSGADRDSTDL